MPSALVVEIGMTILALGVLVYFLSRGIGGEGVVSLVLVIVGVALMALGWAINLRRDDDR